MDPDEDIEHGIKGYRAGHRCDSCRRANTDRVLRNRHARRKKPLPVRVDAEPARRNVKKLVGQGMPAVAIAAKAGVSSQSVFRLLHGDKGLPPTVSLEKGKAKKLAGVKYDSLPKGRGASAGGMFNRLRALHWQGFEWVRIAREAQIGITTITRVLNGTQTVVAWEVHYRMAAYYDTHWLLDGGSQAAKDRSRKEKMVPPGGWTPQTIDDPDALPDPGVDWNA